MHTRLAVALAVTLVSCGGGGGSGGPTQPPATSTGSVRGVVNDNTAAAVPGASASLTGNSQAARTATTAADGSYLFNNVVVGSYTVTVTAPAGYTVGASNTAAVTVVANQQAAVSTIVLTRNQPPAPTLVNVSMVNTSFQPQQIEVAVGGTVRFTNNDQVVHNATGTGLTTGDMNPGAVVSRVLNTAGTINYACTLHAGMNGTITVR